MIQVFKAITNFQSFFFKFLFYRRLKKTMGHLQLQLEEAMEKEVAAHHYLTNLIGLVEKIAKERDHLVFLVITFK